MINPLPIELRPDFIKRMNATKEQGPADWLPIVVISGLCVLAIYIVHKRSKNAAIKLADTCCQNGNQPYCPMQSNRCVLNSTER